MRPILLLYFLLLGLTIFASEYKLEKRYNYSEFTIQDSLDAEVRIFYNEMHSGQDDYFTTVFVGGAAF